MTGPDPVTNPAGVEADLLLVEMPDLGTHRATVPRDDETPGGRG